MTVIQAASKAVEISEKLIQIELSKYCQARKHDLWIPNCSTVFGWESDLASITKSGMAHDHEIKISRGDWLRELRASSGAKAYRHNVLASAKEAAERRSQNIEQATLPPNYFWIVAVEGIVRPDEIPDYAGLIEVGQRLGRIGLAFKKQAPRLHAVKIPPRRIAAVCRGLCLRYWQTVSGQEGIL